MLLAISSHQIQPSFLPLAQLIAKYAFALDLELVLVATTPPQYPFDGGGTALRELQKRNKTRKKASRHALERDQESRAIWQARLRVWKVEQMIFLHESAACERTDDRKYGHQKENQQQFIYDSKDQNVGQFYQHTLWMNTLHLLYTMDQLHLKYLISLLQNKFYLNARHM
ncbi:hypothetical protein MMC31_006326 [Peltigera leucophlebia]|nr:hypothetical protein [Peltigera leucophlebia]